MPTYRYRCSKCGDEFEVWQSINDPSLTTHDTDGGELRKVLSAAGIVLKGSGFYKTDNRSSKSGAAKANGKESSGSDSKSDSSSKSDSKSDSSSSSSSGKKEAASSSSSSTS